eukprot:493653-Pelagomonas_calceolata.AAC.10
MLRSSRLCSVSSISLLVNDEAAKKSRHHPSLEEVKARTDCTCVLQGTVLTSICMWMVASFSRYRSVLAVPNCQAAFAGLLQTLPGVPLELESCASTAKRLTTAPLTMQLTTVISEAASNVTESVWSPTTGMPDDELPEVPKGAVILG